MSTTSRRPGRAWIITPGLHADRFAGVQYSGAAVAVVDIEDSVALCEEQTARRILAIPRAIRLRGWPSNLTTAVPIETENGNGNRDRWMLQIEAGAAELIPTRVRGQVRLTQRRLAVWYAGGYRSTTAARMAGVHTTSETALATLINTTTQFEPWLPDHF